VLPNPAAAATGGLVRVPFSMAWMTDSRDAYSILTGTVTDNGSGIISVPHAALDANGNTRVESAIFTAPISVLATALSVTEADITSGDVGIEVICSDLALKKRVSVNFLFSDRAAADQANNRALACGVGNVTTTANKFSATAMKSNTSGGTTSVVDTNSWTQWLMRVNNVSSSPNFVGSGTFWQLDDDSDPIPFANTVFKEVNTAIVPSHFGLLICAEGFSGEAGTSTLKMTIVARTSEDATGYPG
jgi:hypothetical protein